VTIDSVGLRTVRPWAAETNFRILFIGNSVTWGGTSIDDGGTFAQLTCVQLEERLVATFTCGNAGVSAYGTDNMAARLLYKKFTNEDAIVVTLIYPDMLRGLVELKRNYFFSSSPRGPLPAIWEAGTFLLFKIVYWLRHHSEVQLSDDDMLVAKRSLENLFQILKAEQELGKLVLVVLAPLSEELGGNESVFTRLADSMLQQHGLDGLNLNALVTENFTPGIFIDDRHLEYDGHRLYAQAIADRLIGEFESKLAEQ
jgi:lysophospholipase L1-like esterase